MLFEINLKMKRGRNGDCGRVSVLTHHSDPRQPSIDQESSIGVNEYGTGSGCDRVIDTIQANRRGKFDDVRLGSESNGSQPGDRYDPSYSQRMKFMTMFVWGGVAWLPTVTRSLPLPVLYYLWECKKSGKSLIPATKKKDHGQTLRCSILLST